MIIQSSSRCRDGRCPGRLCSAMLAGRAQEEQGQAGGDTHLPAEGREGPVGGGMEGHIYIV